METFAATIEWYGPYPNLTAVHQAVNNDWKYPWTDGLYMALGEHDKARFIDWIPDALADRVLDMGRLEHDKLPKDEGNRSFYIGDVHPYTGNTNLRKNIGANAALLLIRTLKPVLNDQFPDPEPPAGNNCRMSVFSCFYDINNHEEAIDPLPGFPVIVAYNPYANNQTGRRITVYAPAPPGLQYQDAEPRAVAFIRSGDPNNWTGR